MASFRLKIFDNYSPDIEKIRQYAIEDRYYSPTINDWWMGFRTKLYTKDDDNLVGNLCKKISNDLNEEFYKGKEFKFEAYFHYCPAISQEFAGPNVWETLRFHRDYKSNFAGLYFLNPNPPPYTGTSFRYKGKEHMIDNVCNRLIMFDSKVLHGPQDFFGGDITNARLNLVFFSEKVFELYGTI